MLSFQKDPRSAVITDYSSFQAVKSEPEPRPIENLSPIKLLVKWEFIEH